MHTFIHVGKSGTDQWQVISKFITCIVKLYIRCKSDVLKAKHSKDRAKTGRKGRKREESGVFASGPPHKFVNKFHNNQLLSGGWSLQH